MMAVAHVGITVGAFWAARRNVDYRLVALGALLPDLLDQSINLAVTPGQLGGWLIGHSLVFNVLLVLLVLFFRRFLALGAASLGHLALDQVWRWSPIVFWWPFKGWPFPQVSGMSVWEMAMFHLRDPGVCAAEGLGLLVLGLFVLTRWRRGTRVAASRTSEKIS